MITKLHIQNFKCLRDVSVELEPFTVLIGKNDTGKSSLLEAIHTLSGLVQATSPSVPLEQLAWRGVVPPWIQWKADVAATPPSRLLGKATYQLRVSLSIEGADISTEPQEPAVSVASGLAASMMGRLDAERLDPKQGPAILLIEEPENGVHPHQLQRVARCLEGLTDPARGENAVQVITVTHSPYFLDFVDPGSVLVFGRKPNGETVIAPLLDLSGVRKRLESGFRLGEMWFNVGEDKLLAEFLE